MLKKGLKLLLIILIIICLLFPQGCAKNGKTETPTVVRGGARSTLYIVPINLPDKIIVYKDGKPIVLADNTSDYTKVFDLTVKRFNQKLSIVQMAVSDKWEAQIKKESLGLEFDYSREQTFSYLWEGEHSFSYNRLFFPLESTQQPISTNLMYFGLGQNNLAGPHGGLQESNELVNLIKNMTTFKVDKASIRNIAFQWLSNDTKNTVIDWEEAEIIEYKSLTDHSIGTDNVNIKGIDTYKVTFETTSNAILGPIVIYVDKQSNNVLGADLRD